MAANSHVQILRGDSTKAGAYTGLIGELVYDTTKKTVRVMDGTTAGGSTLAKEAIKLKTDTDALLKFNAAAEADHAADISITLDTAAVADKIVDEILDDDDIAKKLAPGLVSSKTDNALSVASGSGEDGLLFVEALDAEDVVKSGDAILYVNSDKKIATNMVFDYDKLTGKLTVKGGAAGTTLIKEMEIPTSLTLLKTAEVVTDPVGKDPGTYLHFVFATQAGTGHDTADVYIDVTEFIDVYTAGDGLKLNDSDDHKFELKLASSGNQAKIDSGALLVPTDYGTLD